MTGKSVPAFFFCSSVRNNQYIRFINQLDMIEYENNELFYNQMYLCIGHRCVAGGMA